MEFYGGGFIFLVMGVIVLLSLAGGYLAKRAQDRRRREMAVFATSHGFDHYPEGLVKQPKSFLEGLLLNDVKCPIIDQLTGFEPFGTGHDRAIENLLVKQQDGLSIYVMDYYYKTNDSSGDNDSERSHRYTVIAIRSGLTWPFIRLSPEGLGHRVAKMFGSRDIIFESEEFNRKYFISATDEKATYDVLHPRCIDFLLRAPAREWQVGGMYLLVYADELMPPLEIRRVLQEMLEFIALVPDYVRQDRGFDPKWAGALDF